MFPANYDHDELTVLIVRAKACLVGLENPSWKSCLMETSDGAKYSAVSSKIAFVLNGLAVAGGIDPQSAFSAPKCERNEVCR